MLVEGVQKNYVAAMKWYHKAAEQGHDLAKKALRNGRSEPLIAINLARAKQLERLPGIGPQIARRIADYRKRNGHFKYLDDLKKVSGISPKIFEDIRLFIK